MYHLKGQQTFNLSLKNDQCMLNFVFLFSLVRNQLKILYQIQDQRNYNQKILLDFDQGQLINLLVNKYFLDYYQAKRHNLEKQARRQELYLDYL